MRQQGLKNANTFIYALIIGLFWKWFSDRVGFIKPLDNVHLVLLLNLVTNEQNNLNNSDGSI